jgi:hypothetical protein
MSASNSASKKRKLNDASLKVEEGQEGATEQDLLSDLQDCLNVLLDAPNLDSDTFQPIFNALTSAYGKARRAHARKEPASKPVANREVWDWQLPNDTIAVMDAQDLANLQRPPSLSTSYGRTGAIWFWLTLPC